MKRSHWWGPCLALLALVPSAPAQEPSPLHLVPPDAPIVLHLRGVERTKGRLVTLINNALPDLGKKVQESIEDTIKGELGERQLKGLAPFGPALLVFTEMPRADQDVPSVALLLRVTDAKAFREGFFTAAERKSLAKHPEGYESLPFKDDKLYLLERKDYLCLTPSKQALLAFLNHKDKGVYHALTEDAAKRLVETDVGVYVNVARVYDLYGQTVKDARQFIDLALQQAAGQVDKAQMAMIKAVIDGALQGFEDSRGFLLTADFRPDGLALHGQVTFKDQSTTNAFLKKLSPGDLKAVDTLPAGQMTYMAVRADPAFSKAFAFLLHGAAADAETKAGKAIQKALDLLNEAGPQEHLQTANLQTHGIVVVHYKDAAKAAQGQLQLFQALADSGSYNQLQLKKAAVKSEDQKHRGFTLHRADLEWDFEKMAEAQPVGGKEAAEAMRKLMGDGLKVWFGTDGKVVVQATAKDWEQARKYLDGFLDGKAPVGKETAFQEVRKRLPAQANALVIYDVPQLVQNMAQMVVASLAAAGVGEIKIPPAKEKPKATFLGAALTLKAEHISVNVWIPASTAQEVQRLLDPLIQAFGG